MICPLFVVHIIACLLLGHALVYALYTSLGVLKLVSTSTASLYRFWVFLNLHGTASTADICMAVFLSVYCAKTSSHSDSCT